ncbi:MAG TPA: L-lactate dehydrogenase [Candidatus Sulfotelmatobacter sp.]|nr:L-lactate dehydrogenase [Candidatus Sulfotelmatobacter sp.]
MPEPTSTQESRPVRVAVVGAGNVGSTFAYALLLSGLAAEIVLVDANRARAEGEAMDLNHTVPFAHPTRVWAGDYSDCAGATVTVLAAGVGQKPGQSRLDCIRTNAGVWREIVPAIAQHNPHGILLVATNPVDVLTYAAWKLSGLPPARVLGSGTILDTARFRFLLSQHFGVDARSVHAHIIGEHGDSEVPVWSLANIGGMRLADYCRAQGLAYDSAQMLTIFESTRDAAYRIIERKGATYFAVAAGLMRITQAILRHQNTVLSVSSLIDNYYGIDDVCFSLPTVVDRGGIQKVLRLELNETEVTSLRQSAAMLKQTITALGVL